jgi:hypothetical protein
MSDTAIRKATGRFVETELDGELVLMNVDTGRFHVLKETGLAIWRLIDGERDLAALQSAMMERYAVEEARCRAETAKFVEMLSGAGLVECV